MKKELNNQKLNKVNGGSSLDKALIKEIYNEILFMNNLFSTKKITNKKRNDPVNAYDMIEYNKRNA